VFSGNKTHLKVIGYVIYLKTWVLMLSEKILLKQEMDRLCLSNSAKDVVEMRLMKQADFPQCKAIALMMRMDSKIPRGWNEDVDDYAFRLSKIKEPGLATVSPEEDVQGYSAFASFCAVGNAYMWKRC